MLGDAFALIDRCLNFLLPVTLSKVVYISVDGIYHFVFYHDTELGIENHGISLVLV